MSENKKLKIKSTDTSATPKKLVLKKGASDKALKIKAKPLPELNETPDPAEETGNLDSTPKGLTIKAQQPAEQQPAETTPKGLTIKAQQPAEQQPAETTPRGLTIKAQQPAEQQPAETTPRGLTIKAQQPAEQEVPPQPARALTIKGPKAAAPPPKSLTVKPNLAPRFNPLSTPPPIPAPSYQAPVTSSKPPPPMPTGYSAPPPPQPRVNPQGPMFPTQGQQVGQAQNYTSIQGEPAMNPSGPVFPTQNQNPGGSGVRPPGTMPPPTHKRETSAPLSAIMGEVRAAKRISPEQMQQQAQPQQEVVKVKKPAGVLKDSLGNEFCLIPQGTYYIGLENEEEEVKVAFTLAKYPVTKEQYFEFIKESDISYSAEELNLINKIAPYPNCPAVMVSWKDAKAYCRWLREKTGEYYALPSIKEWEAAARSLDGRIYPWGEEEPYSELACFNDGYLEPQSTCSVDYFTDNISPFGCVGMIGNVMEWTLDSFEDDRKPHILKGGSWMSPIDFCNNVTPCMSFPEDKRKDFFGFRMLYLPKVLYQQYRTNLKS